MSSRIASQLLAAAVNVPHFQNLVDESKWLLVGDSLENVDTLNLANREDRRKKSNDDELELLGKVFNLIKFSGSQFCVV